MLLKFFYSFNFKNIFFFIKNIKIFVFFNFSYIVLLFKIIKKKIIRSIIKKNILFLFLNNNKNSNNSLEILKKKKFLELKFFFFRNFLKKNNFFFFLDFIFLKIHFFSLQKKKKQIHSINSFFKIFSFWWIGFFFFFFFYYYLTFIKFLPFSKLFFEWFVLIMFTYWLLSGFVFFFKKYQFGKYTSIVQRFWKRSYIIFWLIESGVFLVFFYLTINSTEESIFMFDAIRQHKRHLFSWRFFLFKLICISFLFFFSYFVILNLKWTTFSKNIFLLFIVTIIFIFIVWLEFYQFFHILSSYLEINWTIDEEDNFFYFETNNVRNRTANNYVAICLFAKFWHLVFIIIFWFFFLLRINETKTIKYSLLAANNQNFIVLYLMSWLYMYPWLKLGFKTFLTSAYYWFFVNKDYNFFFSLYKLCYLFYNSFLNFFINLNVFFFFKSYNYFYFIENSFYLNNAGFTRHYVRNYILSQLNK